MAPGGSDRDAEYALSKLLQMSTVAEYENEFVVLANRVTGISESLLTSFYISGLKLTLQIDLLRARPTTLGEAFALARITEARFEDERATTVIAKPNDLNIAVKVQDIEETTLHTSAKVETMSTSMVATYEEHECQDGFCMVATYEEQGCQDGLKPVTTRSAAGEKGDFGTNTSKGGRPDHMRASEKELAVLKSLLEQKSMFRHQERMLRQEQQRLAKDAKIQKRIWDPGIKSLQDITLRTSRRVTRSIAPRFEVQVVMITSGYALAPLTGTPANARENPVRSVLNSSDRRSPDRQTLSPSRHSTRFLSFSKSARATTLSPFYNVRAVAHEFKFECPFKVSQALFYRKRGGQLLSVLEPSAAPQEPSPVLELAGSE
ncbi:hypothetical protein Tco_0985862 [Tanacetum coccineum]